MSWLGALAVVILLWSVTIRLWFRGPGTLYFMHPFGFLARRVGGPPPVPPRIGFRELDRLLPLLIEGERFDWLGLSTDPQGMHGVTLDLEEGALMLGASFDTSDQAVTEALFRSEMAELGLTLVEDETQIRGLGQSETRDLSYRLPNDLSTMAIATRIAMRVVCGTEENDTFHVQVLQTKAIPRRRLGYWLEPDQDLLAGLL